MKISFKITIFSFILLSGSIAFGQTVTFSPEIENSKDVSIYEIKTQWEAYIRSFQTQDTDSLRSAMWLDDSEDLIKYISSNLLLYNLGNQYTFSIRKINDTIYEINTLSVFAQDNSYDIFNYYKVCAVKTDGGFKFLNYFDVKKEFLNKYVSDVIEYYYPKDLKFKRKEANEAVKFVREFKKLYDIVDNNTITYIVGKNIEESSLLLGLTYTAYHSEKIYAGRAIYPRVVLSAQANHTHELVHAIMLPLYPNVDSFLHEGIATYYGGGAQENFQYHVGVLREYLSTNPINFSNYDWQYHNSIGQTYVPNTIGALIIDYALKNYGTSKVIELFESEDYEDVFLKFGIKKEGINNFVLKELFNAPYTI